jgi:adenylate cyclase
VIPLGVLFWTNLFLNFPSELIVALLLSFTAANIVKFLIEDGNKKRLNSALSEYVSSDIAREILSWEGKIHLDGEKKYLVCFFSDIEGFTNISESLSPEELVAFLREYLGEMTHFIVGSGGHVDKFEWDAVMALWGAFSHRDKEDVYRACQTALQQQKFLKEKKNYFQEKLGREIKVRIWIHAGEAIVGNIGAIGEKMDFTALGDNVNLASRLEGVNKFYGTYTCVSEEVYCQVKDIFSFRYLDRIQVKGKDIPVKIYELRGYLSERSEREAEFLDAFSRAVKLYSERKFWEAKTCFMHLAKSDSASRVYIEHCEKYIENPPGEDWNGVWRMEEK